jgi:Domain of unknown function (DUF4185)
MNPTVLVIASFLAELPPTPFTIESARALPALTAKFTRAEGWTGSDGAYSIPLSPKRTLWLFGDTWIGKVENGKRTKSRMINNTAAWQDLGDSQAPMRFFWDDSGKEAAALLKPDEAKTWHWPGDGAMIGGKLYLVLHVIRHKEKGAPGFQFDWVADDLARIDNPNDEPTKWNFERRRLPKEMRWGNACYCDGQHLYIYGSIAEKRALEAPLALARIPVKRLANLDFTAWEYWVKDKHWSDKIERLEPVIRDGASELSVQRLRGIDGLVMVNIPLGIGSTIVVRHAERPEGPWSKPLLAYQTPKQQEKVFIYAAKGHAELATRDGQLIITWCRNIGDLGEHVKHPDIYIPQAVEVILKPR